MKIGIIGGVSPAAYTNIYSSLCYKYRTITGYYPEIISYSIEISQTEEKNFIENNLNSSGIANIQQSLRKACKLFYENGVGIVTICCNTLSNVFFDIANEYGFQYIITPVLAVNNFLAGNNTRNLLISTKYTSNNNLFTNVITLSQEEQKMVDCFICDKANGKGNSKYINEIVEKYDVDLVVLGCTDVEEKDIKTKKRIIDSNELLVNECLRYMVI